MRGPKFYVFRGRYSKELDIEPLIEGFDGIIFTTCECGDVVCREDGLLYQTCKCRVRPGHVKRVLNTMCENCSFRYLGHLR